jgi:NitT/TauT family transport system substrate-binding protein
MAPPSQMAQNVREVAMSQPSQSARRTRRRAGLALAAAAALASTALAGCSGSSSGLGSPDQSTIRVGMINSIGAVPFQIGDSKDDHAFMDAGLTVIVQTYDTEQDELAALTANKIDIAFGQYAEFLYSKSSLANNDDIRVVSEGYDAGSGTIGLLTTAGRTLPNWGPGNTFNCDGGTHIAVPDTIGTEYLALASWFQSLGVPLPSACAAIVRIPDPKTAIGAVAGGQVAAAVLQEPYVTAGQVTAGLQVAQDLATGNAAAVPVDGYFATKTFTQKYPRTTAIFAAVMTKLQSTTGHRVVIETALRATNLLDTRVIASMQLGTYPSVVLPAKLDIVLRLMSGAGTVSGQLDSAKLTDLAAG